MISIGILIIQKRSKPKIMSTIGLNRIEKERGNSDLKWWREKIRGRSWVRAISKNNINIKKKWRKRSIKKSITSYRDGKNLLKIGKNWLRKARNSVLHSSLCLKKFRKSKKRKIPLHLININKNCQKFETFIAQWK